ncbi:hypothetical protein AB832_03350 [Flavobacteriaceae bacterium (ex Bugula neritina AB1)]|nr:hypothetical protein AB832_03350 [Flavobacteriaceae bacterium (ex Bugula neritina AB1)]
MLRTHKKTAILYFALSQAEESKQKPFFYHSTTQTALTNHFENLSRKSGLDVFHYSEKEQIGTSFGERFANAIESIYDKGYHSVITIGNDTPGLSLHHLHKAAQALEEDQFVLGPSIDGGFYLMGLKKEHFDKNQFIHFSWNTSKVCYEIRESIASFTKNYLQLNYLGDIDSILDVKRVFSTLGITKKKIFRLLQQFLNIISVLFSEEKRTLFSTTFRVNFNKGSPNYPHLLLF